MWPSQIKKHVDRAERSNEPSTTALRRQRQRRQRRHHRDPTNRNPWQDFYYRLSSAPKIRATCPSTPKTPPIELQNSLESPPSPLKVGAFTTKTAKKDGAWVLSPPKPRKKTEPAFCHHHFRCVCARHHQMWVFLCRHQKREFLSPPKLRENLKSPPNPGVTPKASDFERVSTKTERTP